MASVIFHSYNQIKQNGSVKLFKSHKDGFEDGEQLRDFIYVKDVVNVCYWMMEAPISSELSAVNKTLSTQHLPLTSGLYNLGTGTARSFNDLVKATFAGVGMLPQINFIDMPIDIRDKYQYFTEAKMEKLKNAGYPNQFYSLEKGVDDYVRNYLNQNLFY